MKWIEFSNICYSYGNFYGLRSFFLITPPVVGSSDAAENRFRESELNDSGHHSDWKMSGGGCLMLKSNTFLSKFNSIAIGTNKSLKIFV